MATKAKSYGQGGVYQRGAKWWIRYFPGDGREIRESSKSTDQREAESLLRRRLVSIEDGNAPVSKTKTTVGDLLDLVIRDYRLNGKVVQTVLDMDKSVRPFFGQCRVTHLTTHLLNRYIDQRKAAGRANATINNEMAYLRYAYTLGSKCKPPMIAKAQLPQIPRLAVDNVRKGFFELPEFMKLVAHLTESLQPVAWMAYYTGMRAGEIISIKWDQVDLEVYETEDGKIAQRGMIRLAPGKQTKNRKGRNVPLTKDLLELVTRLKIQHDEYWPDSEWLFSRQGRQIRSYRGAWARAQERSGVNRIFHDLRRTGVRNLIRAGVPEKVATRISGHATRSVFDRYNIDDENDLQQAAEKVQKYSEMQARELKEMKR